MRESSSSSGGSDWRRLPAHRDILIAALYVFLTLVFTAPIVVYGTGPLTGDGNMFRQLIYTGLLLLVIYAVRPLEDPKRLQCLSWAMIVALVYCGISLAWSVAPGVGFRRLVLTVIIVWTVFLIVSQLGYQRVLPAIRVALGVALVANFLAVFLAPNFAIHHLNDGLDKNLIGAWRGIMMQKNFAGGLCAITIILFTFDAERVHVAIRAAVLAGAAFFLWCTASKTSAGVGIAALIGGLVYLIPASKYRSFLVPVFLAALIVAMIFGGLFKNPLEATLNDPASFTGRGRIWQALWTYWQAHPLTGAGYGSFWNVGPASPIYQYGNGFITTINSGHNGYLDLMTTVGLPGLLIVLFAVAIDPISRLIVDRGVTRQQGALLVSIIMFCLGHNSTESTLFDRDAIVQVFLMFAIAMAIDLTSERKSQDADVDNLWRELGIRSARN